MKHEPLPSFEVSLAGKSYIFHCRMASVEENEQIESQFAAILPDDKDRLDRQYFACRDALGKFATATPELYETARGEGSKKPIGKRGADPETAVADHFAERTAMNERLIRAAYNLFQTQMQPDFRFLGFPTDGKSGDISSDKSEV